MRLRLEDAAAQWREPVALNPKLEIERKDLVRAMVAINHRPTPAPPLPAMLRRRNRLPHRLRLAILQRRNQFRSPPPRPRYRLRKSRCAR